jgi:hypothetical protein
VKFEPSMMNGTRGAAFAAMVVGGLSMLSLSGCASHQAAATVASPNSPTVDTTVAPPLAAAESRNWHMRTGELLKRTWGVEVLSVRLAAGSWMLTFRYKILDPGKATVLLDAKSTAYLVDEATGARLSVPAMENIGELRQTKEAITGREYFMMFGNANQLVRRGSKVDVVIGNFHADGLIVE